MKNKNGFVMTETLVVTVFLATIFTFIYVSIIPLMGKYEDMAYRDSDVDILYKLYNIRKMVSSDSHRSTITSSTFEKITCSNLDTAYCNKMMEYLELNSYILVYADNIHNRLSNFNSISGDTNKEIYNYISKYDGLNGKVLVLFDKNSHKLAHLLFY